jgi:hypothetical protein
MHVNRLCSAVVVLFFGSLCCPESQKPKTAMGTEQSSFSLELPLEHPVKVPDAVLQALRRDSSVTTNICGQEEPADATLRSWLEATEVHLARNANAALLIKGKSCLQGANEGPFWIFNLKDGNYQQILSVSALAVKVCRARTNNYRNISAGAVVGGGKAAFALFKFDGKQYRQSDDEMKECN